MSKTDPDELAAVVDEPEQNPEKIISEEPDPDSDSSEETLADDDDVPRPAPEDVPEVPEEEPVVRVKRKYTKRQPKPGIPTSDENVTVILKTRKKGPRKKQVIVYKEDLPQEPIEIVEKVRRRPGRPKKPVVEVVKEPDEEDVIVFQKPTKVVKMTAKELRKMELEARLLELQAVSGNANLKMNKSGKVDGRQSKVRTQKQIEATNRLVEMNKLKRMKKRADEKDELMSEQKDVVKNIIGALNQNKVKKVEQDTQQAEQQAQAAAKKKQMSAMFD